MSAEYDGAVVMECILRCVLPDRPGTLAAVAREIANAGGDIEAVEVIEITDGRALDDLVIVLGDDVGLADLVQRVESVEDVETVHVGPSRGHPGDAVTRLAIGIESLLNGALPADRGVITLVGGLLRASSAELVPAGEAPRASQRRLVLPVDDRALVVRREYRFTDTERRRAEALLRVCLEAATHPAQGAR